MRRLIVGCLTLLCVPGLAFTQDSSLAATSPASLIHTSRVYFDSYYMAVRPVPSAVEHMTYGNATYAPFTADHWQVGVSPSWQFIHRTDAPRNVWGGAAMIVNYVFLDGTSSRPYAGVFLQKASIGSGTLGVQAGWLRFLTPSMALRAEARYRATGTSFEYGTYDLLLRLDPYLFGRAKGRLTSLPGFGSIDVNFAADYAVPATGRLAHSLSVSSLVAPFITRWLQAGADGWLFYEGVEQHQLELFGRAYVPIDTRLVPFGEVFTSDQTITEHSHGGRAGVRAYLTRGVALDAAFEWRNYQPFRTPGSRAFPESRLLHAGLTTQVGIR
jgi:hypothetical protein